VRFRTLNLTLKLYILFAGGEKYREPQFWRWPAQSLPLLSYFSAASPAPSYQCWIVKIKFEFETVDANIQSRTNGRRSWSRLGLTCHSRSFARLAFQGSKAVVDWKLPAPAYGTLTDSSLPVSDGASSPKAGKIAGSAKTPKMGSCNRLSVS
jgi:hypothetical protein